MLLTYVNGQLSSSLIHKVRALCFELLLLINGCPYGDINRCLTVINKNGVKGVQIFVKIFTFYLYIALFESCSISLII